MDRATFGHALDFLEASQINQLRLLGGEPTIHPHFLEFIQTGLERGFQLLIFSNGFMPEKVIVALETIPPEKVQVVINTLTDPENNPGLNPKLKTLFMRLTGRVIPGMTIDAPDIEPDFLLEYVREYRTARRVRLGIAHPRLDGENRYLLPRQYKAVGKKVGEFWVKAREQGVTVDFDCGFVPCMFPESYWPLMDKELTLLGNRCNPILDILPDGTVVSCFPLDTLNRKDLQSFRNAKQLRKEFSEDQKNLRNTTLFPDCTECAFLKSGWCAGGCLAASLKRMRNGPFSFSFPDSIPMNH